MFRETIYFTLNSKPIEVHGADIFAPLSDTLRYGQQLTGTKVVCAEGDCGACSVMIAKATSNPSFKVVNSCVIPTFLMDSHHVITIEGLNANSELHEIQDSMIRNFGGQCGFCTPGFVMAIANMYESKEEVTEKNVKNYLTGNLCRCTGYQPIINAALDVDKSKLKKIKDIFNLEKRSEELVSLTQAPLMLVTKEKTFFAPREISDACDFLRDHEAVTIFSGATDLGVQINKGKEVCEHQLSLQLMSDLYTIETDPKKVRIGAKANLAEIESALKKYAPSFSEFLNIFASPQIKNIATLVGNIANASPIADSIAFLMCVDAKLEIVGSKGKREVALTKFYKAYKDFDLNKDEFITAVSFDPRELKNKKIGIYKISQRRDLDISCVNASYVFDIDKSVIKSARISYGGVAEKVIRLENVEKNLVGKKIDNNLVKYAQDLLEKSIKPISDVRGTNIFRKMMVVNLFAKFAHEELGL